MGKVGAGGVFVVGILLFIFGVFIQSGLFEWLLDIAGAALIIIGIIIGIIGLVQMLTRDK